MLLEQLKKAAPSLRQVYERSYKALPEGELVMFLDENGEIWLAALGQVEARFRGEKRAGVLLCPTDHANRLALGELFSYTRPTAFGPDTPTFGFGDRLGFANAAQLRAIAKTDVRPVLAQQSLRELTLTSRRLEDVLDAAAWAVFREGYELGYGCDGDHLKTLEEVRDAVAAGATMITLDCSLVLRAPEERPDAAWAAAYEALPGGQRDRERADYLDSDAVRALGLAYSPAALAVLHHVYDDALALINAVYRQALAPAGRPMDFEVSLDETEETTTPEAHYFVAREMQRLGVRATSVAPKFVGEFQKAIDYIGDLALLRSTMAVHACIARHMGYKLSLHSGSEKFSVLPILGELTKGLYHVKTAGTSWLEVVETIAKNDPALYRRMHRLALEGIDEAKKNYVVHCDPAKVRPLDAVSDGELPAYLLEPDARQLMHITYGYILRHEDVKEDIFRFLRRERALYEQEAEELYDRHFAALGAVRN